MKNASIFTAMMFFCIAPLFAQWSPDPTVNVPICQATGNQTSCIIASDGAGGAILAWIDMRISRNEIYAQRINAAGVVQWATDGVNICTVSSDQQTPQIISDGAGGALFVWLDNRAGSSNLDIYSQRIDPNGNLQWNAEGVVICNAVGNQGPPCIVPDGSRGAIIAWQDLRSGSTNDVYAQRIDGGGLVHWPENGVPVCTSPGNQQAVKMISAGADGAIIVWQDSRAGTSNNDIYAQRLDGNGVPQWTYNGVAVCAATGNQTTPDITGDGWGGAMITWRDTRSSRYDIFAQWIDDAGALHWTPNGTAICTVPTNKANPKIAAVGNGGAIVTWCDYRVVAYSNIFAQRIDLSGAVQWTNNGIALGASNTNQLYQALIPDSAGGAIVVWHDYRGADGKPDIYGARVNSSGSLLWPVAGLPIGTAIADQVYPTLISCGTGCEIVGWEDFRNGGCDIYAQRVSPDGSLPIQLAGFTATSENAAGILLEWYTVSEENNYGFYVERRTRRDAPFATVSSLITGAGTSNEMHHYAWIDEHAAAGRYYYRLRQVDLDGATRYSSEILVAAGALGVGDDLETPHAFALSQNYPNPFNPTTDIGYRIVDFGFVTLKIFDILGQPVATLVNGTRQPGAYHVSWDASALASGVYYYRLDATSIADPAKHFSQTRKMLLAR